MARDDADSLISRLREMGEEGVTALVREVMANDRWRRRAGRAGERLMENKQSFDRSVETLLDFVNLPSKKDVRDLKQRLDHLSGQLLNLSMKLDRVLERGETPPRSARKPKPKA